MCEQILKNRELLITIHVLRIAIKPREGQKEHNHFAAIKHYFTKTSKEPRSCLFLHVPFL